MKKEFFLNIDSENEVKDVLNRLIEITSDKKKFIKDIEISEDYDLFNYKFFNSNHERIYNFFETSIHFGFTKLVQKFVQNILSYQKNIWLDDETVVGFQACFQLCLYDKKYLELYDNYLKLIDLDKECYHHKYLLKIINHYPIDETILDIYIFCLINSRDLNPLEIKEKLGIDNKNYNYFWDNLFIEVEKLGCLKKPFNKIYKNMKIQYDSN